MRAEGEMTTEIDYYELLEVERTADGAAIKSAYRKLAMKYHPDVADDPASAETFTRLSPVRTPRGCHDGTRR